MNILIPIACVFFLFGAIFFAVMVIVILYTWWMIFRNFDNSDSGNEHQGKSPGTILFQIVDNKGNLLLLDPQPYSFEFYKTALDILLSMPIVSEIRIFKSSKGE